MDVNTELKEQVAHIQEKVPVIIDQMPIFIDWGMRLLSATLILIAGWVIGNWLSNRIQRIRRLDETLAGFLGHTTRYAVMAVAFITILGQFGVQTASLLAVLGAVGLAVGLALQGTLSNVAAGTMLLILRPFKVGDYIVAGGIGGTVKSLGLFGTEMATPDNVYIFVPNSSVWNADIWNYTRNATRRQDINVGISYGDDIGKAVKVIEKVLENEGRLLQTPEKPQVMTDKLSDFSVDLIVRFWCGKDDYWALRWDVTKAIKEALEEAGITIPFPTRTVEMVSVDKGKKAA
jgi:small conductance mechanosensitive channel